MRFPNSLTKTPPMKAGIELESNSFPMAAKSTKLNLQDDGRSFRMRGFETTTKIFRVALLALLTTVAMGGSMFAQSANPVPWPAPGVVPPPSIVEPASQTRPAGVLFVGQIQFASLDATPGLCNKDDNPAPTPDNPPLP